ncbi:MAG: hypothetical protein ACRELC_14640, partial [Gemmatimonadota bacterium]
PGRPRHPCGRRTGLSRVRALARLTIAGWATLAPAASRAQTPRPDTVEIRLETDGALVEQRIHDVEGTVEAYAIRLPGQRLEVERVEREGTRLLDATLSEEPGAYRFRVRSGAPVRVRFRVSGVRERVPLFVGSGPGEITIARGAAPGVVVRLVLPPARAAALDLSTSLPRFAEGPDGVLTAEPPAVPAFVRLSGEHGLPFARVADLAALVVLVLSGWWAWRKVLRAARARPRGAAPPPRPPEG